MKINDNYLRLNESYFFSAIAKKVKEYSMAHPDKDIIRLGMKYTITPRIDGMFNVFFFELLADIMDEDGNMLGYCFVELLPGVRNKTSALDAFRKK